MNERTNHGILCLPFQSSGTEWLICSTILAVYICIAERRGTRAFSYKNQPPRTEFEENKSTDLSKYFPFENQNEESKT